MAVKIGLVGTGTVGGGCIDIIQKHKDDFLRHFGVDIELARVCSLSPAEAEAPQVDDDDLAAMREELDQLRQQAEARERELQDAIQGRDLEIAGLNNEMDMLRLQGGQSLAPGGNEDLLVQRRQAADEAAQLEQQRLTSSMIAIGGGGVGSEAAGADRKSVV